MVVVCAPLQTLEQEVRENTMPTAPVLALLGVLLLVGGADNANTITDLRQALDAGEVDDLIITVVPMVLGEGVPLFAGVTQRHPLKFTGHYRYGGMVQLHARPAS